MKENTVLPGGSFKKSIVFEIAIYSLIALSFIIMLAAAFFTEYAVLLAVGGSVLLLGTYILYVLNREKNYAATSSGKIAGVLIIAGVLLRLTLAAEIYGYTSDVDCFMGWSYYAYTGGLDHFYTGGFFADYPPLYMYVLYFLGMIQDAFSIYFNVLLIKLPAIAADIVLALLIYNDAKKRLDKTQAVFVLMCVILNGAMIVNSAAWGQIDILFAFLALICVYFLMKEKYAPAVIVFILTILLKVQGVLLAPLLLFVFARGVCIKKTRKKTLTGFLIGLAAGIGIGWLLILPFSGGRPVTWVADLYLSSLGGYSYVGINAFNLYALAGLNWAPLDTMFLGIPFNVWGTIGIAAVCVYAAVLYRMDARGKGLFSLAAFITLGVYMFGHSMHERYSFAAPVFLLVAYVFQKKTICFMRFF